MCLGHGQIHEFQTLIPFPSKNLQKPPMPMYVSLNMAELEHLKPSILKP